MPAIGIGAASFCKAKDIADSPALQNFRFGKAQLILQRLPKKNCFKNKSLKQPIH